MDVALANPALEEHIRIALRGLETLFKERAEAHNRGDQAQVALINNQIPPAMRRVGDAYYPHEQSQQWYHQAEAIEKAGPEEKEHLLESIGMGLALLIGAPLALALGIVGGAVFTAGSIVYGVGKVAQGLGSLLTGGVL